MSAREQQGLQPNRLRPLEDPDLLSFTMRCLGSDEKLLAVIAQDFSQAGGQAIRMFAYANRQAVDVTLASGLATFWSRSRQGLWTKGKESGNVLRVVGMYVDCDADCLLYAVDPVGPTCHTGANSCFVDKTIGEL